MNRILKVLFFLLVVRIVVLIVIGLSIRNKAYLPRSGPAILVANHNSHLDTLVLMSLFPLSKLHHLRPLADEEYFLQKNRLLAWFSQRILDIIPVCRTSEKEGSSHRRFLASCTSALNNNDILILYPEGTRGEPESLTSFKSGIAHLAKLHPNVPIVPIFLKGLGKALPKGEFLLIPFFCNVFVGEPIFWNGNKQAFLTQLTEHFQALSTEATRPA
jgi:1-acyl-sn-glycerol-3-phosphate acyltransferase